MSELNKLKEKHQKEIQELQDSCPHEEVSDWVEYWWAIGHPWGWAKYCKKCGKIMERKVPDLTAITEENDENYTVIMSGEEATRHGEVLT